MNKLYSILVDFIVKSGKINFFFGIAILIFSNLFALSANAQTYTKHYIAPAPWQYWSKANEVVVATNSTTPVTVTIQKSNGTLMTTLSAVAGTPAVYRFTALPNTLPMHSLNTVVSGAGMIVTGTKPISVNVRNVASDALGSEGNDTFIKGNASLFSFGDAAIGTSFRVGYYRDGNLNGSIKPIYTILAIEDNTTIKIAGVATATLNAGQSYLFQSAMGTLVESSGPAVMNTSATIDAPGGCGDAAVNPIPPVSSLGSEYVVVRGGGNPTAEQTVIVASEPNTSVTVSNFNANGVLQTTLTYNLVAGGSFIQIPNGIVGAQYSASRILATKNVVAYAGTAISCEVDVATLAPIASCGGSLRAETYKFRNYAGNNLPYFAFILTKSLTDKIFLTTTGGSTNYTNVDIETLAGVGVRRQLGSSGVYLIDFTEANIGTPTVLTLTSGTRLTVCAVQQGGGFSMANYLSPFPEKALKPSLAQANCATATLSVDPSSSAPYQWFLEGVPIPGATNGTLVATASGNYTVTSQLDCGISGQSLPVAVALCNIDRSIIKTVDNATPSAGGTVNFTLKAKNLGVGNAVGVSVTDVLPSGYTFISSIGTGGTSYNSTTGLWSIGSLASNQEETLIITARVLATGNYTNTATISGPQADNVTANNTSTVVVTPTTSISVTPGGSDAQTVCIGNPIVSIVYTIGNATGATVTGLPPGVSGTYSGGKFTISGTPTGTTNGALTYTVTTTGGNPNSTVKGTITVNGNVGTPVFTLGTTSVRCQRSEVITYGATAANSTSITYSLAPAAAGVINSTSGEVTWSSAFTGSATITAAAAGCSPKSSTHTVTVTSTGAISGDATVCSGSNSGTLTLAGQTPGSTISRWESSIDDGMTWQPISNTTTSLNYLNLANTTLYRAAVSAPGANCPDTYSLQAKITVTPVPIVDNQTVSVCTSGSFLITPAGVPSGTTYSWGAPVRSSAAVVGGVAGTNQTSIASGALSITGSNVGTLTYTVTPTYASCQGAPFTIVVTLVPSITASTTNPSAICSGTAFSVTPTSNVNGMQYTWTAAQQSGGTITGFSNQTVARAAPIEQVLTNTGNAVGVIRYTVTPTLSGCSGATFTFDVTVQPSIANNTITGPAQSMFCGSGDPGVITGSTPTGGSGTYTYQWQSSLDNVTFTDIAGATAATYDAPSITQTTYYKRVVNAGVTTCGDQNSNVITITVQPAVSNNVVTAPAAIIFCANGDPGLITGSTPIGGDGVNYSYQWQISTDNISFTNIASAIGADYDPPAISQTTYFKRLVTSGACSIQGSSNVITFTVNPVLTPGTISANQTFCVNGDPATFTELTAPTGGNGSYTHQWQVSSDNTNFTNISGATQVTYDAPAITQTTYYRRVVSSTGVGCGPAFSSSVSVVILPLITGNNLTGPTINSYCETGDPGVIVGSTPIGGSGTYVYTWEQSTNGTDWSPVIGASGKDFDPNAISVTTQYRRLVSSGTCNTISTPIIITVNKSPTVANAGADMEHCVQDLFNLSANTPTIGIGVWAVVSGQAVIDAPNSETSTVNVPQGKTATLSWTITNGTCPPSVDLVTLTNYASPAIANAGQDITQNNSGLFTLQGNVPNVGTGKWTVKAGSTARITDPTDPNTEVTIAPSTSATLVWTISNGPCGVSTDEVTINFVVSADIVVAKTLLTTGAITAGQSITYQIVTSNNGPSNATGVIITDAVPSDLTVTSIAANASGSASVVQNISAGNSVNVTANIDSGAGNSVIITVTGTIRSDFAGSLTNTVTATSPNQPDPNGATSTVTTPVTRKPVLAVVKNGPANVVAGQSITYKITISNTGKSDAISTVITDAIPSQITNISWTASKTGTASFIGAGTGTGNAVNLTGSIPAGSGNTIVIDVTGVVLPSATGSFDNIAKATPAELGVPPVNSNTVTTNISSVTGLVMLKNGPSSGEAGKAISYTLTIANNGSSDARNAIINDLIPAGIKNVSWTATTQGGALINGNANGSGNSINLNANIPTGGTNAIKVTVNGTIDPSFSGELTNTAIATPSETGSLPSSSTAKTTVTRTPVVGVSKAAPVSLTAGQAITYTITATNMSPADAKVLVLKDNVPAQITNISWTASAAGQAVVNGTSNGTGNVISITGDLPTGATNKIVITVTGTVNPSFSGSLENTVTATPSEPGTTPQTATAVTEVSRKPVLAIQKNGPATIKAGEQITYTIDILNTSTSDAVDVSINDLVPAGLKDVSWTSSTSGLATVSTGINGGGNTMAVKGSIPSGVSNKITMQVTGTVDPSFSGTLINTASATPQEPGTSSVNSTVNTEVSRTPVISLSKSGPASLIAGQQISYTIEATNLSTSDAKTLAIVDNVPAQISNVSWTASVAGTALVNSPLSGTGNAINITGDLPAGAANKITITVNGTVDPAFNGTLTNNATATPAEPGTSPKTATSTTTISRTPVLAVQKGGPGVISAGQEITYTVVVSNTGTANAIGATIKDLVPANITNVTWTTGAGGSTSIISGATGSGNNIELKANVPAGASNTITVNVKGTVIASATGSLVNTATVTPIEPGTTPGSSTLTTVINSKPSVTLVKTGPTVISAGQPVTYTLTATNNGPSDARALAIADIVPATLTNVTWTATATGIALVKTGGSGTGNTVSITGDLPAGSANTILVNITGLVPANATSGTFSNTAVATPSETGITPVNSNTITTTLNQRLAVTIQKSAPPALFAGEDITYTLLVGNTGPSDARNLSITDEIPAGITNVSWTATAQGAATLVSGSTGTGSQLNVSANIPGGNANTISITIKGKVDSRYNGTQLVNTATATPAEPGNSPVNSNTTTTKVSKQADIQITKGGPATVVAGSAVTYTLLVNNQGPSKADNVNIVDNIPVGIVSPVWTATATDGATLSGPASGTGNINLFAAIPSNAGKVTIVINGTLAKDYASASLQNTATATPETGVVDPSPATSTVTTTVSRVANVRIIKSGPADIGAGGAITYSLRVINDGPSDASGVEIRDVLPALVLNATWTATASNGATVSTASGTGDVSLSGNIPSGTGEINVVINGTIDPGSTDGARFSNTATANFPPGSPITDPDLSSNSSKVSTNVNNDPVLKVSKSGPSNINIGDRIDYTITIRNGGAGNITNAEITDNVPSDVEVISWTATAQGGATLNGGTTPITGTGSSIVLMGDIPAVDPSTVINIAIQGKVKTTARPTFTNTVSVEANGRRESSVITAVNTSTDIVVEKAGPQAIKAGENIAYTIKVSNAGPIDAAVLNINDIVPTDIQNVNWTAVAHGLASVGIANGNTGVIQTTADIAAGSGNYILFNVTGTVNPAMASGSITNTAAVVLPVGVTDFNMANNTSNVTTVIASQSGFVVRKSGPQDALSGTGITYTIKVSNAGPSNASQAEIRDVVPAGINNVTWTTSSTGTAAVTAGSTGTGSNVIVTANFPAGSGNEVTIIVKGTIDPGFTGELLNTATVTPTEPGNPPVNSDDVKTTVTNKSGIRIVKSGPSSIDAGKLLTYRLEVTNSGPGNAVNAQITDAIPATLTNISWTTTTEAGATISSGATGSGNALAVVASLPAGASKVVVTVTAQVPADAVAGNISNTAKVTPSEPGNPEVPSDPVVTEVIWNSGLTLTKSGPSAINAGENITYTLNIGNNGPSNAKGAQLSDVVPSTVRVISWNSTTSGGAAINSGATGNERNINMNVDVPVGGNIAVTVNAVVEPLFAGSIVNKAVLTPSESGKTPIEATVTTTSVALTDIKITKSATGSATAGQQLTYQIAVSNNGPSTALATKIEDNIPAELKNVSWSTVTTGNAYVFAGATGTGNNLLLTATIPAGQPNGLVINVQGTIDPSFAGTLRNTAKATPNEPGNPPVVTPAVETVVRQHPVVVINKTGPATAIAGATINYVVEVENTGLSNAKDLVITDNVSANLTNVSWAAVVSGTGSITQGATGTGNAINVKGDLPAASKGKITITVKGTINPSFAGTISNVATTTPSEPGNPPVVTPPVATKVDQKPVIVITKSGLGTVSAGGQISYAIDVSNTGLSNAKDLVITDNIPANIKNVNWTTSVEGTSAVTTGATGAGNTLSITGNIPAGLANKIHIKITGTIDPSFGGTLSNVATATPSEPGNPPVITPPVETVTEQHPVIVITKIAPPVAIAGAAITYTIEASNTGLSNAKDLVISDNVSAVLSNVSWTTAVAGAGLVTEGGTGTGNNINIKGNIPAGAANKIIVTIKGTISPSFVGILNNVATATPSEPGNPPVVTPPAETQVDQRPVLKVTKTGPSTTIAGAEVAYIIEVVNTGLSDARNLVITDEVPAELSNVSWIATAAGNSNINGASSGNGNQIIVNASIPTGTGKVTIALKGTLDPSFSGKLNNSAIATPFEKGNPPVVTPPVTTTVDQKPIITLTKKAPASAVAGAEITYVIEAGNTGLSNAKGLVITDNVPVGLNNVSWTAAASGTAVVTAGGNGTGNAVSITGNIPAGNGSKISITVKGTIDPSFAGKLSNTAKATPSEPGNPPVVTPPAETEVSQKPVIVITKTAPVTAVAGEEVTYVIEASNTGLSNAKGLVITDNVPAELSNVSWSSSVIGSGLVTSGGTGTGNTISVTGNIPVGNSNKITITIKGTVAPSFVGILRNTAIATPSEPGNPTVVTPPAETEVGSVPGVTIRKRGPVKAVSGTEVIYLIEAGNTGLSDAVGLTISDAVPAALSNVTWSSSVSGLAAITSGGTGIGNTIAVKGNIPAGGSNTILITVKGTIASSFNGNLTNTAIATPAEPGTTPVNSISTTVVSKTPVLSIQKNGPSSISAGQAISYTLTIINTGTANADNAAITDIVPVNVNNVSWTAVAEGTATISNGANGTGNLVSLNANIPAGSGNVIRVTVNGTVNASASGNLENSATVTPAEPGTSPATSTVSTVINQAPSIALVKTGPSVVSAGQTVTYTLTASNNGPSNAHNLSITDAVPAGLTNVSWTTATTGSASVTVGGNGTGNNVSVKGDIGAGVGNSIVISVSGKITPSALPGTISNVATATPSEPGIPPVNSNTITTIINNKVNIRAVKSAPSTVSAGEGITYTLQVFNDGPGDAKNLSISDDVPPGITNVSWSTINNGAATVVENGTGTGNTVNLKVNLPAGAANSVSVVIKGTVATNFGGSSLKNSFTATPTEPGNPPVPSEEVTTNVGKTADLRIEKTGPQTAVAGSAITYTINVSNAGPSEANNVTISDVIPAGISNVSWTAGGENGATINGTGSGTINNISVSANIPSRTGNVLVTVNGTIAAGFSGASIVNTATATPPSGTTDSSPATSTVTTAINRVANVRIVKSGPANIGAGEMLTYNLRVVNDGPSDAPGVQIKDVVPSNVENITWTAAVKNGATVSAANGTGNIDFSGNLPSGTGEIDIEIKGRVKTSNADGAVFTNTATAGFPPGSPITDPEPATNSSSVTTKVNNDPVLKVSKSGPSNVNIGDPINYAIVIRNGGAGNIVGAQISDPVPTDIAVSSWTAVATGGAVVKGSASGTSNSIITTADIPADGDLNTAITIHITGTVKTTARPSFTNTVTVTANGIRESSVVTTVNESTDIHIDKSGTQTASAGSAITYSIKVGNAGPIDVTGLTIRDNVPLAIEQLSWTAVTNGAAVLTGATSGNSNAIQTVGNIPVGAGNYITIQVKGIVKADAAAGIISNTADVQLPAGIVDFNMANNSSTVKTNINNVSGLAISKSGPQNGVSGSAISYTIRVVNNGPSNANQAVITDAVPAGISNVSWTATGLGAATVTEGSGGVGNNLSVRADIPSGAGNEVNILVNGTIDASFVGQLVNSATATPSEPGNSPVTSSKVTTKVVNKSGISIVKSGPSSVVAGRTVTYTLEVSNVGPANAMAAVITDAIPATLTNVSWIAEASSGAVIHSGSTGTGNAVSVNADILAGSAKVIVHIVGQAPSNTTAVSISNIATVTPSEPGNPPVPSNQITTDIVKTSNLTLVKSGPAALNAGEKVTYNLVLTNSGPSSATGVKLEDVVPAQIINVSWSSSVTGGSVISTGATGSSNNVTLTAGLPVNGSVVVNIIGTVDPSFSGKLSNIATATPSEPDNPPVATPPVETIVTGKPGVVITKKGPATINAGNEITYVIEATNTGSGNAKDLVITDMVPAQISNVKWTTTKAGSAVMTVGTSGDGNAVSVTGNIPAGASNKITITVKGTVDPSFNGKLSNIATATPSEPGNPPVVTPPAETTVTRNPGLAIVKAGPTSLKSGEAITYTIDLTNTGQSNALNIDVTDRVPMDIVDVTWKATIAGTAKIKTGEIGSGNNVSLLADIPSGQGNKISITITGKVSKSFTGRLVNTAKAQTADGPPIEALSNTVETIIAEADFVIPNIITPNKDGNNDTFKIKGLENYPGTEVAVFNRWGNQVYHSKNYTNDWDGSDLNEGTYYYIVSRKEKTGTVVVYKGWLFIRR